MEEHLSFSTHTQSIIDKTRSAVRGLLTLKHHGVQPTSLVKSPTLPEPGIVIYLNAVKKQLQRHQSLCLRLIFPAISSCEERLETLRYQD